VKKKQEDLGMCVCLGGIGKGRTRRVNHLMMDSSTNDGLKQLTEGQVDKFGQGISH
jgi:hypothetical protein